MKTAEEILKKIEPCDRKKPYIFISYSSRDSGVVYPDVLELQRRGYNVWLDEKNLDKKKDSWKMDALTAIESFKCRLLVFYVGKHSLLSPACYRELEKTREETTCSQHGLEALPFIAIETEPITDIVKYAKGLYKEVESEGEEEEVVTQKFNALANFVNKFFNGNNERVRIHAKKPASDEAYYNDIIRSLPEETKIQETRERQEPVTPVDEPPIPAPVPAPTPAPAPTPVPAPVQKREAKPEGKKTLSVTGDVTYTLYGREFTENQSNMMLRFFAQVLKRHPEAVADLPDQPGMNCVSRVDYTDTQNRGSDMPSYFRVCRFFPFGGGLCVGTAYSVADKLKKMALLLAICGEDREVFHSEQVTLPEVDPARSREGGNSSSVTYTVYGETFTTNQTDMVGNVFSRVLGRHPDKLETAAERLLLLALEDYSQLPKAERPSYFAVMNVYTQNGRTYSVGGGMSMKDKLKQISKLLALCGEPLDSVVIQNYALEQAKSPSKQKSSSENFLD